MFAAEKLRILVLTDIENEPDDAQSMVRFLTPDGTVTTLAGAAGEKGSADGKGAAARFNSPRGLAVDAQGHVFVMDTGNHEVRKVAPDGTVTTVAGKAGESGFIDGTSALARFAGPRAAAFDAAGDLYVADSDNHAIRVISAKGEVRTVVGVLPPTLP